MPSPDKARSRARASVHEPSRLSYPGTLAMLGVACAFPISLMVFNPTLMFERGWEQYVGTSIYFWAVFTLGRELIRLWRNESAFRDAPGWLGSKGDGLVRPGAIAEVLRNWTGGTLVISGYIAAAAVISFIAALFLWETYKVNLQAKLD